jgi:hypothetical protein
MRRARSSRVRQRSQGRPYRSPFSSNEQLALLRTSLELVEVGNGACGIPEGGVTRDVVHPLGPDIDRAAVAHALELFFSADQHCSSMNGGLDTLAL